MTWLAVQAFARTMLGKLMIAAMAALVVVSGFYLTGRHHGMLNERGRWELKAKRATEQAAKTEAKGAEASSAIKAETQAEKVKIEYRTRTIIKEVPRYVTAKADRDCPIPAGFVSVYDAAARGSELPAAPSGSVEADSGVALSAIAETDVFNLGVAHELRGEVLAWRKWYVVQERIWREQPALRGRVEPPPIL